MPHLRCIGRAKADPGRKRGRHAGLRTQGEAFCLTGVGTPALVRGLTFGMKGASFRSHLQPTRKDDTMTDPRAGPSRVESKPSDPSMTETAARELTELAKDIQELAAEIRDRISLASEDAQLAWSELDARAERFRREVEQESGEGLRTLRETGFSLKRRLRRLRDRIKPTDK